MKTLVAPPLTQGAFAPFGEVIETAGQDTHILINEGLCKRFTDLARFDVVGGAVGLSLFQAKLRPLPHICDLVERHPLGSQCFIPMGNSSYLVIVAPDAGGTPGALQAFTAGPDQIVNIGRNVWHGVLAPISGSGLFAVMDRIGGGVNLEEHPLEAGVSVGPEGQ
jgi:ureidoglycolate lyase